MALPVDSFLRNPKRRHMTQRTTIHQAKAVKSLSRAQIFKSSYFHFSVPSMTFFIVWLLLVNYSSHLIYLAPKPLFDFSLHKSLNLPYQPKRVYDQAGAGQTIVLANASHSYGLFYTAILGEGIGLSSLAQRYQLNLGTLLSSNYLANLDDSKNINNIKIPFIDGLLLDVGKDREVKRLARHYGVDESLFRAANHLAQEVELVSGELFIPQQKMSPSRLRRMIGTSYIYPVFGSLSQPFGTNRDAITGLEVYDKGVLFQTQLQAAVLAIADGVVVERGYHQQFGYYLLIDHGECLAFYAHLQSYPVFSNLAKVKQGEQLGQVQQRNHNGIFYFSLIKENQAIDPIPLLR